ncbi:MAG: hypothetical protein KDA89_19510, partial [Planctomycetaceae bacterium]|nr:hypothetical protein [Planctomycetaceae bacterium]
MPPGVIAGTTHPRSAHVVCRVAVPPAFAVAGNAVLMAVSFLVLSAVPAVCSAEDTVDIEFDRDVRPIFMQHCIDCHGPETAESALRLDSAKAALQGGDSGETVISPGNASGSHLIERLTTTDAELRMPPGDEPLSDD